MPTQVVSYQDLTAHKEWRKILIKKITQTAVINIIFQCIFIRSYEERDVSYASQHTYSKVTVTIFEIFFMFISNFAQALATFLLNM